MEKEVLESLGKGRVGKCEWSGSSSSYKKGQPGGQWELYMVEMFAWNIRFVGAGTLLCFLVTSDNL